MRQLGMFARFWAPGQVKTRLAADIGPVAAAAIYRAFVECLAERFAGAAERCVIAHAPDDAGPAFARFEPLSWRREPQGGGDLGQRMRAYFERAFHAGATRVALIGTDAPDLPRAFIERAFDALDRAPVVLGPAVDGGYYLVAARGATPPIFDNIAWSSALVFEQTTARLAAAGLSHETLAPWSDVDTAEDLARLRTRLSAEPQSAWARALLEQIHPPPS